MALASIRANNGDAVRPSSHLSAWREMKPASSQVIGSTIMANKISGTARSGIAP